jgi:hypothetical protein
MSRNFTRADSDTLISSSDATGASADFQSYGFFYLTDHSAVHTLMFFGDTTSGSDRYAMQVLSFGAHPVRANRTGAGQNGNVDEGSTSTATWFLAGMDNSATDHTAYVDTGSTTDTAAAVPSIDSSALGVQDNSTPANYLNGRVMWAAVEQTGDTLDGTDVAKALSEGVNPLHVPEARGKLTSYWPLAGTSTEYDIVGGHDLTNTGTTVGTADEWTYPIIGRVKIVV